MKLFTNGFPKSGNHALVKACELLGQPARVDHLSFSDGVPPKTTHHIFIKRDPRNVVVSKIRESGRNVTAGLFLTYFRRFDEKGKSLIEELAKFEPWLTDNKTYVVRYEDLIASDAAMRGIADYLNIPYLPGAFEDLPGLTVTWNQVHSDYRTLWIPEVESAWNAEGGTELLTRWGY